MSDACNHPLTRGLADEEALCWCGLVWFGVVWCGLVWFTLLYIPTRIIDLSELRKQLL